MTKITMVELRTPADGPEGTVDGEVMFVGSTRPKALDYIAGPHRLAGDKPRCWYVYDVELDDPKMIPHDRVVIGLDGTSYGSQREAWDACQDDKPSFSPA